MRPRPRVLLFLRFLKKVVLFIFFSRFLARVRFSLAIGSALAPAGRSRAAPGGVSERAPGRSGGRSQLSIYESMKHVHKWMQKRPQATYSLLSEPRP